MDKFNFGQYDSTKTGGAFTDTSYVEPTSEIEVRKELSYPLGELKDYINTMATENTSGSVLKLKIADDQTIKYSTNGGNTWSDTASSGHLIYDGSGNQLLQTTRLMFRYTNVYNNNGYTVVEGLKGDTGDQGPAGPQGERGSDGQDGHDLVVRGRYSTLTDLQNAHPEGEEGWFYFVGSTDSNLVLYLWDVDQELWRCVGQLRGPAGPAGSQGAKGDKGDKGDRGDPGEGVPVGGAQGQALVKNSDLDNDVKWSTIEALPSGGTQGQSLVKNSDLDNDVKWANISADGKLDINSTDEQAKFKYTSLDMTTTPESSIYKYPISVEDNNGNKMAQIAVNKATSGKNRAIIQVKNTNGDSNSLALEINESGGKSVSFSDVDAWKSALNFPTKTSDLTNDSGYLTNVKVRDVSYGDSGDKGFYFTVSDFDSTTTPASDFYRNFVQMYDVNEKKLMGMFVARTSNGANGFGISAKSVGGIENYVGLYVTDGGTRYVEFSDVSVWRKSLGVGCIDTSRVLSNTTSAYTATENCIVICKIESELHATISIDSVAIGTLGGYGSSARFAIAYPLAKGQKISWANAGWSGNVTFRVFGIK